MQGRFDIGGVSILSVLTVIGLLVAAGVVRRRGRGPRWSQWGAAGCLLLALATACGVVATQWFLRSDLPVYRRVEAMQLLALGGWLISTAGFALLVVAVLSERAAPAPVVSDRGPATPEGAAPPPR